MAKRRWYVVIVGRDVGVFPTWLEAAPLVKGVTNAIHQSFLTRAEATHMFAEAQARGTTRIINPDLDATPPVNPPQRPRNYSAPSHFSSATSAFGVTPTQRAHHRSPLSVHPTTTSSRNRTSENTPSSIFLSDRRAPIVSGTSNSSPATFASNPRSALGVSPSMFRFQMIQAALEQEARSSPVTPARSQVPVQTPGQASDSNPSNSRTLTPSSRTNPLQRAATASPEIFRSQKTHTHLALSVPPESVSTSVAFDARAPPVIRGHSSHTNTYNYTKPNRTTGGARTSNPTAKSTFEPSSSSRGSQKTPPDTPDTFHGNSRMATFDSLGRSSVSPRAVIRTPDWLPPYPTARTPSPDSDSSAPTRSSSPGPSDQLLSPLSNVNLNSFALDNPRRGNDAAERTPSVPVNSSSQTRCLPVFANGTHHHSSSTGSGSIQGRLEIKHDSDPRSPILCPHQIPDLTYKSALEIEFARPSPQDNPRSLTTSQPSVNGHGPSLLFRH